MKIINIVILLFLLPFLTNGQVKTKAVDLYSYNYKKCLFTIKVGGWTTHQGKIVLPITAILNNTADDTLKYETMTYRMLAYYIKSKNLEYEYANEDILKNFPIIITIPPHQVDTLSFNLIKKTNADKIKGDLRVGFCLVLLVKKQSDFLFEDPFAYTMDDHHKVIPHSKELKKRTHWLWSENIKL